MRSAVSVLLSFLFLFGSSFELRSEEPKDFYKGKTITIVVGHEVGTGFDTYSRLLARHLGNFIPGSPTVIVQNMPGASGVTAANWAFNIAPKDGTVLATFAPTVGLEPLFGNPQARYAPDKFVWVGNLEASVAVCIFSRSSEIRSFSDLMKEEVVMGAAGPTGPPTLTTLALKNLLGAKIRLIMGYKGAGDVKLAIKRGEVKGICGLPWSTISASWRDELDSGEFLPVLQVSGGKLPEPWKMQHYLDLDLSENQKQVLSLIFGIQSLGRPYAMPPGTPIEQASIIMNAFVNVAQSPEFLADAKKLNIDIAPMDSNSLRDIWRGYAEIPKSLIDVAKQAVTP